MPSVPTLTIVNQALAGLNVLAPGEPLNPDMGDFCLSELNAILDGWNADRQAVWCSIFSTYALTPGLQPHTIGPTGTFVVPERPVSIEAVSMLVGATTYQRIGVTMDPEWWANQGQPGLATGVYYVPDVPNGSLYFGGVLGTSVRLLTRRLLSMLVLTDVVVWPQGYQQALTLTLRENLAEPLGQAVSAKLEKQAGQARGRIFANNIIVPTLSAVGAPGTCGGWWNYKTGLWEGR